MMVSAQDNASKYNFFKEQKTYIKNPFELRDPFRRLNEPSKSTKRKTMSGAGGNFFSNGPVLEEIQLATLKVVGILLGKERRAMAKIGDAKDTFILKEGMKIGPDSAEIKAILPGGIVLVEKIVNVYDQEEYLETIIPVSE